MADLACTDAVVWLLNDDAVPMSPKHLIRRLRGLGRNDTLDTMGPRHTTCSGAAGLPDWAAACTAPSLPPVMEQLIHS